VNYSNKYLGTNFQPGDKIKLVWIRRVKGKYPPTDVVAFYDGFFIPLEFEVDWDRMIEINITNKLKNLLEGFPINLNLLTSQKPISEFL
jgi:DNA polymerase I